MRQLILHNELDNLLGSEDYVLINQSTMISIFQDQWDLVGSALSWIIMKLMYLYYIWCYFDNTLCQDVILTGVLSLFIKA